jgi:hypothetical protein
MPAYPGLISFDSGFCITQEKGRISSLICSSPGYFYRRKGNEQAAFPVSR